MIIDRRMVCPNCRKEYYVTGDPFYFYYEVEDPAKEEGFVYRIQDSDPLCPYCREALRYDDGGA